MNKTAIATAVCLAATAALTGPVLAQAPSCSDVVWNATALERLPNASDYCLDVVERGGAWYAKLHAKVVRQGASSTVVRYQQPNGDWSESERTYPPSGLTADIDGQAVKISDMQPGQEVNIYVVDKEYFSIPMLTSTAAPAAAEPAAAVEEPVAPAPAAEEPVIVDETPEEPAPAMLPSTAGQANWLVVAGTLLLLLAGVLRIRRNRT